MLQYREIFYKQYFSSQLGRNETSFQKNLEKEAFQIKNEILPLIKKGKDAEIVDLGCGIGALVKSLIDAGYTSTSGIDVSEQMVEVAQALGILQVKQGDVSDFLRQHKSSFDVITGIDIIEHFTKDELVQLLILIKEALKPNGVAIFRTPNVDAPYATIFANGDFTHENYLNSSSAKQVMLNCGFSGVEIFPSLIQIQNPVKEWFRKRVWALLKLRIKIELFASGRSSKIVMTPNLLIRVTK